MVTAYQHYLVEVGQRLMAEIGYGNGPGCGADEAARAERCAAPDTPLDLQRALPAEVRNLALPDVPDDATVTITARQARRAVEVVTRVIGEREELAELLVQQVFCGDEVDEAGDQSPEGGPGCGADEAAAVGLATTGCWEDQPSPAPTDGGGPE